MASRKRKIGLIFSYDEGWIAGAYYIFNLVHAINKLPDENKPHLVIFTENANDFERLIKETHYSFVELRLINKLNWIISIKNRLNSYSKKLISKNVFDLRPKQKDVDIIFPFVFNLIQDYRWAKEYFKNIPHKLFWIPDFQERFYPQFFQDLEIKGREEYQYEISNSHVDIVFSSNNAMSHYDQFYPNNNSQKCVLPFAVQHPELSVDAQIILEKYNISGVFYLCSNQFWKHKNHQLILNALHIAIKKDKQIKVVFTGNFSDRRNPGYFDDLKKLIEEHSLSDNVYFLGLIPREDQLCLLKHAMALVQPSLFEGWSTVLEDAKALNQYILASSLPVHKEQLAHYPNYKLFDPKDPAELAEELLAIKHIAPVKKYYDYEQDVLRFSNNFISLVDYICKK